MDVRYLGRLKKWNAERGFGFIVADDGGAELFVHISAFPRNGLPPVEGEALSFEVEPDRGGKRRAVRVQGLTHEARPVQSVARRSRRDKPANTGSGFFGNLLVTTVLCALAFWGYSQYSNRSARFDSNLPSPPVRLSPAKLPVPTDFRCDGRNTCSQMTSCNEAKLFLQNCPGMQMDGNGDGVPCEQQWCTAGS